MLARRPATLGWRPYARLEGIRRHRDRDRSRGPRPERGCERFETAPGGRADADRPLSRLSFHTAACHGARPAHRSSLPALGLIRGLLPEPESEYDLLAGLPR